MDEALLMGLYAAASMRAVDAAAIDGLGIPGGHLMERAGAAVADEILERFDPEAVVVYAGKGNNGGDGFVVARELFNAGCDVVVYAIAGRAGYKGDALLNLKILDQLGVEVREGIGEDDDLTLELADVVVDAIFGTGFTGAAKGVEAAAIQRINESRCRRREHRHRQWGRREHRRGARAVRGRRPHRGPARGQGRPLRHARRSLLR